MTLHRSLCVTLLAVAACSSNDRAMEEPTSHLSWSRADGAITVDGVAMGSLARDSEGWNVVGDRAYARLATSEKALDGDHPYPRRVEIEGRAVGTEAAAGASFRQAYTLLAPPAPLPVEGYGLEVAEDEPGTNAEEHERIRRWLGDQGLPADTTRFQELHQDETGRELRVFYEISGRRVDGMFERVGHAGDAVALDTHFRSEDGGLKIHHKRPGENGRFTYHRRSLELADVLRWGDGSPELHAHECGCYGYAIAADFMTLGDRVYEVEADWLDDRVAAEFFFGFEAREGFPWVGIGDRRRMRDLARRARAWILKDASDRAFAKVSLDLPDDPPPGSLGPITYHVDEIAEDGARTPLARIEHTDAAIRLSFFRQREPAEALARLDQLFAAMPAQIMRGDGIRDSHLGEVELLVDAVLWIGEPGDERLADLVSDVDALTAARKVDALLSFDGDRFALAEAERPPAPIPGPGSRTRHASRD